VFSVGTPRAEIQLSQCSPPVPWRLRGPDSHLSARLELHPGTATARRRRPRRAGRPRARDVRPPGRNRRGARGAALPSGVPRAPALESDGWHRRGRRREHRLHRAARLCDRRGGRQPVHRSDRGTRHGVRGLRCDRRLGQLPPSRFADEARPLRPGRRRHRPVQRPLLHAGNRPGDRAGSPLSILVRGRGARHSGRAPRPLGPAATRPTTARPGPNAGRKCSPGRSCGAHPAGRLDVDARALETRRLTYPDDEPGLEALRRDFATIDHVEHPESSAPVPAP
jgi:hypothetical protein